MRMTRTTDVHRYNSIAQLFHWTMAVLLIGLFCLGLYMQSLPFSPQKLKLYSWHKWAGVVAFILVVLRLGWRMVSAAPKPVPMPAWQQKAAHLGHLLLYVLMFAIPLTGWLMSSAKGVPTVLFGLWPLPDLIGRNNDLGNLLQSVHWYLNLSLALLVAIHVLAAIKHQWIDRDGTLSRMLPARADTETRPNPKLLQSTRS